MGGFDEDRVSKAVEALLSATHVVIRSETGRGTSYVVSKAMAELSERLENRDRMVRNWGTMLGRWAGEARVDVTSYTRAIHVEHDRYDLVFVHDSPLLGVHAENVAVVANFAKLVWIWPESRSSVDLRHFRGDWMTTAY